MLNTTSKFYLNRLLRRIYNNGYILMDTIEKVENNLFKVVILDKLPVKHYNIYKIIVLTKEYVDDNYFYVANEKYFIICGYYIYNIKGNIIDGNISKQQYIKAIKCAKKCISPMINKFDKVKIINVNTLPYTLNIKLSTNY